MNQNSGLPGTNSSEPGATAPGKEKLTQNQLVKGEKRTQPKKAFSGAPFELAGKISEISATYSKSEFKEALTMLASLNGLRVVPIGIALKTPEPVKTVPAIKQKVGQRISPSGPSLGQACRSNPQYVDLENERQKVIFNLKQEVGGIEAQEPLKASLQDLSQKIKTLKAELREKISSNAVEKAT